MTHDFFSFGKLSVIVCVYEFFLQILTADWWLRLAWENSLIDWFYSTFLIIITRITNSIANIDKNKYVYLDIWTINRKSSLLYSFIDNLTNMIILLRYGILEKYEGNIPLGLLVLFEEIAHCFDLSLVVKDNI